MTKHQPTALEVAECRLLIVCETAQEARKYVHLAQQSLEAGNLEACANSSA